AAPGTGPGVIVAAGWAVADPRPGQTSGPQPGLGGTSRDRSRYPTRRNGGGDGCRRWKIRAGRSPARSNRARKIRLRATRVAARERRRNVGRERKGAGTPDRSKSRVSGAQTLE